MQEGSFCYARLRVAGIVDDKTTPFYAGPEYVCVPINKDGRDIEPVTVFYFTKEQLVDMGIVKREIAAIEAYKQVRHG